MSFSPPNWDFESKSQFWYENVLVYCDSETHQKCILGLKTPSRGSKNISTYLQNHLRAPGSSLTKSQKIAFLSDFSL